jgi:pyruvate,water dikinase
MYYGILSHPAILLREAGVHVEQSYALYDKRVISRAIEFSARQEYIVAPIELNTPAGDKTEEKLIPTEQLESKGYIVNLDSISTQDLHLVGSKALNLSKLKAAGFSVPQGFVVTTLAYQEWFTESSNTNIVPQNMAKDILQAFNSGAKPVAVRSSATVEDLSKSSSAGIYKTTLNVSGEEELIEAVQEGFRSFNSQNAKQYRLNQSIAEGGEIALLVQELVDAESSGVMFTGDPSGNSNDFVINSTFGLGEPLVSGRIAGDTYRVEDDREIDTLITDKEIILTKDGEASLDETKRSVSSLSKTQIRELVQLGKAIEDLFGSPQDIEFVIKDGRIWILQSRPITR